MKRLGLGSFIAALFVLLANAGWTLFNGLRDDADSYAGLPRAQDMALLPWQAQWFHVIDPAGFVLGYSERLKNPLWVAYRLDERSEEKPHQRPKSFTVDRQTLARVNADDYRDSGFNRGHMAPNYAMSRFIGRQAQLNSFRMSNIVPQKAHLNQKLWQRLEEIETDVYARLPGPLWVIMGPLFPAEPKRLASGVAIPTAFFRIWLREDAAGQPQALAFIVPQQVSGYEPLDQFVVSIDEVERRTGLDMFHQLDDRREVALESKVDSRAWKLSRYASKPPRY